MAVGSNKRNKTSKLTTIFLWSAALSLVIAVIGNYFELKFLNGFFALSGSLIVAFAASFNHEAALENAKRIEETNEVKSFNLLVGEIRLISQSLLFSFRDLVPIIEDFKVDTHTGIRYLVYMKQIDTAELTSKNPLLHYSLLAVQGSNYKAMDSSSTTDSAEMMNDLSLFVRNYNQLENELLELEKYRECVSKFIQLGEDDGATIVNFKFESYVDKLHLVKYLTLFESVFIQLIKSIRLSFHILTEMPTCVQSYVDSHFKSKQTVARPSIEMELKDSLFTILDKLQILNDDESIEQITEMTKKKSINIG